MKDIALKDSKKSKEICKLEFTSKKLQIFKIKMSFRKLENHLKNLLMKVLMRMKLNKLFKDIKVHQ